MQRIPVVDQSGKPLMPTTPQRARRWLEYGKAVKHWSDAGVFYVQLTQRPSDTKTQPVVVGIDPGKRYSGIGVQSPRCTLFTAHLVLPFETLKKRMEQRATMRRTRRSRRINRDVPFKERNHREKRFDNRRSHKLSPSIQANRQLELRVVRELYAIYPVSQIVYERVAARTRPGCSFSPVQVGQNWAIEQLNKLAPVRTLRGWETANLRRQLGLVKSQDKSEQSPASHAVDGIALAASEFIRYAPQGMGRDWTGAVNVTACLFKIIRRPPICRRQLHLLQFAKGGKRRSYGGTVTRHGFRKGDLVRAVMAGRAYVGWVSGDTQRQVSVSNADWKRLGQFVASKVELIARSTGLMVS